jgi:hypothetical protein
VMVVSKPKVFDQMAASVPDIINGFFLNLHIAASCSVVCGRQNKIAGM